jgi:NTE family protein
METKKMIAFVLSGAGNRGPLEIGALKALLEQNLHPNFLVGTSAGAINACYLAAHGASVTTTTEMGQLWRQVTTATVYPGNLLNVAWRVVRKIDSLYSSDGVRQLIQSALPANVNKFGDLAIPLYVTAADLLTSRLFVFGEDVTVPLMEAVLASASMPAIHPPVRYHDLQLVDGGLLANVAASVAMDRGATEIYAINASYGGGRVKPAEGVLEVIGHAINTMTAQSLFNDLARAQAEVKINLHHIQISSFYDLSFRDFSKADAMIQAGYDMTKAYLAAPRPQIVAPPAAQPALGATVPGAREYILPYLRGR